MQSSRVTGTHGDRHRRLESQVSVPKKGSACSRDRGFKWSIAKCLAAFCTSESQAMTYWIRLISALPNTLSPAWSASLQNNFCSFLDNKYIWNNFLYISKYLIQLFNFFCFVHILPTLSVSKLFTLLVLWGSYVHKIVIDDFISPSQNCPVPLSALYF